MSVDLERLKTALADRYAIERELGRGGMATVYLAEDLKHHRQVAIKVLHPELAAALGPDRFLREIEIAAQLHHPHILPLYDSGTAGPPDHPTEFLFYAMPYVEGESLRDRLDREKQLSVDDALQVAREVADALSYAHAHGVIHRDIKPENILLESGHAVVADFGIARAVDVAGGERLTETGVVVGTPEYMSPEQAAGGADLDGRSDLYALGCVLHEMLAGQPPFTGPTPESLVRQHLTAEPPSVTAIRPSVPEWVAAALERSLAKTPADRFNLLAQFGEAITAGGGMTPTGTRPVRTAGLRSRAAGIGAVAAVIIAVIGAALLLSRRGGEGLDPNRVLVVALTDETGSEGAATLGRMAQDYIIQILTDAGFAEVVDPLTALAVSQNVAAAGMAGGPGDIQTLADEARAGTVVSGSYYAAGDSVHIQIRISDARDGSLMRAVGPIVGSLGAPSPLVARLGREVVAALGPLLDRELGSWEPTVQPAAYEAYAAYLEGLEVYLRADVRGAGRHFERAAAADPTFHRAKLWAAQSYQLVGPREKADSLIAMLVEAREQLSRYERCRLDFVTVVWGPRGNLTAAYDAARCMAEAAPGSDDARREVALAALRLNRPREAIELLIELDPDRGLILWWDAQYWDFLGVAYHMVGDYKSELDAARQGRQRLPRNLDVLWAEARALAALGRLDDVRTPVAAIDSLYPEQRWVLDAVFSELRAHGHRAAAREVF